MVEKNELEMQNLLTLRTINVSIELAPGTFVQVPTRG